MDLTRRRFLRGVVAAPFVITTPGLLMQVRDLWKPRLLTWSDILPFNDMPIADQTWSQAFLPAMWSPKLLEQFYNNGVFSQLVPQPWNPELDHAATILARRIRDKIDADVMADVLRIGRVPAT